MHQNFLLTAIYSAVFFPFKLSLLLQSPRTIITHVIKLNILYNENILKSTCDILKWKAFWGSCLPVVTSWKVSAFLSFTSGLSFILEHIITLFLARRLPEKGRGHSALLQVGTCHPTDLHSPKIWLNGTIPSYRVMLQTLPSQRAPRASLLTWASAC